MNEIYEVRAGEKVIGTFTSESKARSFAKANRDKGKLKIIHRYIDEKKTKKVAPAPKPQVKPVPKEKPKAEKPKKSVPKKPVTKPKAEKPKKVVPKKSEKLPIWKQDYNKISEPDNGFFILSDGSIFGCFISDSCDVEPEERAEGVQYFVNAIRYCGNLNDEVFILLPVHKGDSVEDIVKAEYNLTVVDFVEVEDAYELWDAIDENRDQETIDEYAKKYPKLFAGIKKKAVSKPKPSKPAVTPKTTKNLPMWKQVFTSNIDIQKGFFILSDGSIFGCFVSESTDLLPEEEEAGMIFYVNSFHICGNENDEVWDLLPVYKDSTMESMMKDAYDLSVVDYVQVEDSWSLMNAFGEDDTETIDEYAKKYPKLFAGIKKKAVSKPVSPPSKPELPKPAPKTKSAVSKPVSPPSKKPITNVAFLKGLNKALCKMNCSDVPIYQSSFPIMDAAHIIGMKLTNRSGKSLFGFPDGDPRKHIALDELLEKSNGSFEFDSDGNAMTDKGIVKVEDLEPFRFNTTHLPEAYSRFEVDANAFKTELTRAKKILGGNKKRDNILHLVGRNGDLIMESESDYFYGLRSDVGDGDETGEGSWFYLDYLAILPDIMAISDGKCILELLGPKNDPLKLTCTSGDWLIETYIAPRIMED